VGAAVGSLIPDMDHPHAMINQRLLVFKNKAFKQIFYLVIGLAILLDMTYGIKGLSMVGVFVILTGLSKHRGFTHQSYGHLFFSMTLYMLYKQLGYMPLFFSLGLGYWLHLVADDLKTNLSDNN